MKPGRLLRAAALLLASFLAATATLGCTAEGRPDAMAPPPTGGDGPSASDSPSAPTTPPPGPGAAKGDPPLPRKLTAQRLDWKPCKTRRGGSAPGAAWRCATLRVPLDYAEPRAETLAVALIKAAATGPEDRRVGSLLFNFGGPGGSGVDMLPVFAPGYERLRERYDLVSFDPRGVAGSSGIRCRDDRRIAAAEARVDLTPDDEAEEKAYFEDAADFGRGCAEDAAGLLPHLGTAQAARDLDLLRHILGDRALHYFGISYGTQLGAAYAHQFPDRAGRLVLDAAVDPEADMAGHARNQTIGFQRALENYLRNEGRDPRQGSREIAALLARIDAEPLPTASGRKLTESLALTGIITTLYSKLSWPRLTEALDQAEEGSGTALLRLADSYNDRDGKGRYGTQGHAQRAISCADDPGRPTPEEARKLLPEFRSISPVFGGLLGWDTAGWCHEWPVDGVAEPPGVEAKDAPPVLVVGTTGDPATPYEGARRLADGLGEGVGVLLTHRGEGHGAYGSGSGCVDRIVDAYLLDGTVPEDGKECAPDKG
ncbi:alpha/beta hydrolase [Streptomyces sp. NPDC058372]|uniref:alpha/beta hydrolase n=1 Tax=Streptomyces sp. NPDC058372 TaxID=3346464 RepID=UPI003650BE67